MAVGATLTVSSDGRQWASEVKAGPWYLEEMDSTDAARRVGRRKWVATNVESDNRRKVPQRLEVDSQVVMEHGDDFLRALRVHGRRHGVAVVEQAEGAASVVVPELRR